MTTAHGSLLAIFERFAKAPAQAWLHADGDLSFDLLHGNARALAARIAALQNGDRSPVLVLGHKDRRFPVGYWACLLLARPVVPVEPDTPPDRINEIAMLAGAGLLLDARSKESELPALCCLQIPVPVESTSAVMAALEPPCVADGDVCYILFSSGTTGSAKGIQISYANVADFLSWLRTLHAQFGLTNAITGTVRHCFDVSLYELWSSWITHIPVCTLDHRHFSDPAHYVHRLRAHGIDWWVSTPSVVRFFLKCPDFNAGVLPHLRTFLFCGEVLSKETVVSLWSRFPAARIYNSYGPTECTVAVTGLEILPEHLAADDDLPIGRARPGTRLMCSSPSHNPDKKKQRGEIIISGRSVGMGYLDQPERQAAAFPSDFTYRTGDQGSCGADGVWYFHGRQDREVKIQGVRIDLNVVESAIRKLDGVEDAVVDILSIHGEARALNAYVVGPDSVEALAQVAGSLSQTVSPYLVPRKWYGCRVGNLNQNGKLDRAALVSLAKASTAQHVQSSTFSLNKMDG